MRYHHFHLTALASACIFAGNSSSGLAAVIESGAGCNQQLAYRVGTDTRFNVASDYRKAIAEPVTTYKHDSWTIASVLPEEAKDKQEGSSQKEEVGGKGEASSNERHGPTFSGNVSWYGTQFNGKKTASGEIFNMNHCTSAHLKLPFFTRVLVEDPSTGQSVIVKVIDRGPYVHTRVMDLSREGARRLGMLSRGVAFVDCLVLGKGDSSSP